MVEARGRRVLLWADILLLHPEVIPRLKPGTIVFPWRYQVEPSYDRFVQPFADAKVPTVVTSGVWNYSEAAPDFDHTKRNVDGLVTSAHKFGARGLLHAGWTDSGQVLLRMAWASIACAGVAFWQQAPPAREVFYRGYWEHMFGTAGARFGDALAAVSEAQQGLETAYNPTHTRLMDLMDAITELREEPPALARGVHTLSHAHGPEPLQRGVRVLARGTGQAARVVVRIQGGQPLAPAGESASLSKPVML